MTLKVEFLAPTACLAVAGALFSATPADAARFEAREVVLNDITADVRVVTNAGGDVNVDIRHGKQHQPVDVRIEDGVVIITGEKWRHDETRNCCDQRITRFSSTRLERAEGQKLGPDNAFFEDYPVIEITMPRDGDLSFNDARMKLSLDRLDGKLNLDACYVYGETSALGEAVVGVIHGSRLVMGDVGGMLELDVSGSAAVRAGNAAMVDIDLAGNGDVSLGSIDGMLDVSIAGSGLVRATRAEGPVTARIAGSGALAIQSGLADPLKVTIDGSGTVIHEATAIDPVLRLYGSSEVRLGSVRGKLTHHGSGTVYVDGKKREK